jgi:predicted acyl esterase
MMAVRFKSRTFVALAVFLLPGVFGGRAAAEEPTAQRLSSLGRYEGYSAVAFDGWMRTSQYVTVRDGTRIALDIFRPTNKGRLHAEALAAISGPPWTRTGVSPRSSIAATIR